MGGSVSFVDGHIDEPTEREKLIELLDNTGYFINREVVGYVANKLLANGVMVRKKGKWLPCFIYTHHDVSNCLQGHDGWQCSICGESFDTQHDYCVCGADMRKGENDGGL